MLIFWVGFILLVFLLLALDLGVFHRKNRVIKTREAILWTAVWIALALVFNTFIYYAYQNSWLGIEGTAGNIHSGSDAAIKFFTGYVIEKSLSLDNIFVIAMIFAYFRVPAIYQHRVLFWGILGALLMRGIMIGAGVALIEKFTWMIYVFGVFLIITAIKMLIVRHDNLEPEKNILVKIARKLFPVTDGFEGPRFFSRRGNARAVTPLFLVLLIIESTDVLFAVDSIPAIFAITTDPYIIFTSNVFAILGLRSLYFALAAIMDKFRYIKMSLVFVLAYVGVKMILSHIHPIPTMVSLCIISTLLIVGIVASITASNRDTAKLQSPL
ncbi:MAG: TerC family protein [Deltaproteobacteria bacterium]|nr:TerC family protein [Deltaproteobacteria bacterium]